jgi:hypothetical protein
VHDGVEERRERRQKFKFVARTKTLPKLIRAVDPTVVEDADGFLVPDKFCLEVREEGVEGTCINRAVDDAPINNREPGRNSHN